MNAMFAIRPYKTEGIWAFDDTSRGLVREPFVFGIPELIEKFTEDVAGAESGFNLYFSSKPFPGYHARLIWQVEEYEGNWYRLDGTEQTGWLCPALLKYFEAAPAEIFCRVEPATVLARG